MFPSDNILLKVENLFSWKLSKHKENADALVLGMSAFLFQGILYPESICNACRGSLRFGHIAPQLVDLFPQL